MVGLDNKGLFYVLAWTKKGHYIVSFSLIETAKANDSEPYRYLRYLFEKLPHAETNNDYLALLPYHLDAALLNRVQ